MCELTMCVRQKGFQQQGRLQAVEGTCNRPQLVSLNPLRTGQPADRMMDDDHSMKDEAAEVEDIEDQEEQHGVVREEPILEDWFGSFAEDEPRVHDGGLARMWLRWRQNQHMVVWTRKEGQCPGGCANLSWSAKESVTNIFRTVTRATCVSEKGSAKQLTGRDPKVRRRNRTRFHELPWTFST